MTALLLVDYQPRLLASLERAEVAVANGRLLADGFRALALPVFSTAQNPERLGGLVEGLHDAPVAKMRFSAAGLHPLPRRVILAGVETHVCVALTARDLLEAGHEVVAVPDACASSTFERHKLGMETVRDLGALPMATETALYDLMDSADHPAFRTVLSLVKAAKLSG